MVYLEREGLDVQDCFLEDTKGLLVKFEIMILDGIGREETIDG